jgi:hypothetical protein
MPPWDTVKRRGLIAGLRKLGFEGPFSGGKHEFMKRGGSCSRFRIHIAAISASAS